VPDASPAPDLCLLQVHAHPDDEASKGAGTAARYVAEGARAVLVTCTGGEAGEILNAAVDSPENREHLTELRREELAASVRAIGYTSPHLLGYHDSGMPDTETNQRPDNFWNADLDEATGRLVRIIRAARPQVLMGYGADHAGYPHPDHIRVHDISVRAFEAAGDPDRHPDAGPPWQPLKLYSMGFWTKARILAVYEWHERNPVEGEPNPYDRFLERLDSMPDSPVTTRIDVGDFLVQRRNALLAHATQVDPNGHWMRMPDEVTRTVFPWEEFVLERSLVDTGVAPGEWETDLFAGIRTPSRSSRP
jgi:mycothiol S-conjugate amidase